MAFALAPALRDLIAAEGSDRHLKGPAYPLVRQRLERLRPIEHIVTLGTTGSG